MRVVTYEDRPGDTVGVKLLLLSLIKHCPGLEIDLIFPGAPQHLHNWLAHRTQVHLHSDTNLKRGGYDVKPSVLTSGLDSGQDAILWIDTDIIISRDIRPLLASIPDEYLVVTQEWFGAPFQGGDLRSRSWKMPPGRRLPATTNTCVVRVTSAHHKLLEAWDSTLAKPEYIQSQQQAWWERPIHMQGDQEVLCALLESQPFAGIPIHFLRRGRDIIHCFQHQGYAAHQMIGNILTGNRPYFVHGQGAKPWREDNTFRTHLDVSAYTLCALEYASELEEDVWWLRPNSPVGVASRNVFRDNPWLSGLPLALYEEAKNQRIVKTLAKKVLRKS